MRSILTALLKKKKKSEQDLCEASSQSGTGSALAVFHYN